MSCVVVVRRYLNKLPLALNITYEGKSHLSPHRSRARLDIDYEPLAKVLQLESHDRKQLVLEAPHAVHVHVTLSVGNLADCGLAPEVQ
jgi:hypothetical protein